MGGENGGERLGRGVGVRMRKQVLFFFLFFIRSSFLAVKFGNSCEIGEDLCACSLSCFSLGMRVEPVGTIGGAHCTLVIGLFICNLVVACLEFGGQLFCD